MVDLSASLWLDRDQLELPTEGLETLASALNQFLVLAKVLLLPWILD
jgi:hypothetical protein